MSQFRAENGNLFFHCNECGNESGLPLAQLHKDRKCTKCKAPIPAPSVPLSVDTKTFDNLVKRSKVPVFVDFWASWCAPCKRASPEVAKLAAKMTKEALILKVNTESEQALASRLSIRSIPNFMIFKGGKVKDQRAGLMSADQMEVWLRGV